MDGSWQPDCGGILLAAIPVVFLIRLSIIAYILPASLHHIHQVPYMTMENSLCLKNDKYLTFFRPLV